MNKTILLMLMLVAMSSATVIYTVDADRSGFSSATLSMEGEESVEVSLPDDASNFRIIGGSYEVLNNTAVVSSGSTGFTTFSFSSSSMTAKTASGWKLSFSSPAGSKVRIFMPAFASIENSFPQPDLVSSEDSTTLLEMAQPGLVIVYYRLGEPPPAAEESGSGLHLLVASVVIATGLVIASSILRGRASGHKDHEKKPTTELTPGKKEMMETFNENDLKIVKHLLEHGGRSRRNELERKTGISKSSLAMAINRLEKRKIIGIDRSATTHFIKLSDYFLRL